MLELITDEGFVVALVLGAIAGYFIISEAYKAMRRHVMFTEHKRRLEDIQFKQWLNRWMKTQNSDQESQKQNDPK